nr:hypothetical protein [Mycoplasmopsis bovis]
MVAMLPKDQTNSLIYKSGIQGIDKLYLGFENVPWMWKEITIEG